MRTPSKPNRKKPQRPASSRGKPGTPAFVPTDQQRQQVQSAKGFGLSDKQCATLIAVAESTLRKHFRPELDRGLALACAQVGESLFKMAVGSPAQFDAQSRKVRDEQPRVPAAAIFWAKCRLGFQEVQRHEHSGPGQGKDGKPAAIPLHLDDLNTSQLEALLRRISVALDAVGG